MANGLIGFPIWSDVGVLYTPAFLAGIGSWAGALPLTNLQDRRMDRVARSSSAAVADTRFQVNLGTSRSVGLFALPKHTISSAGKLRVRGLNGNIQPTSFQNFYDFASGWTDIGTPTRVAANVTGTDGVALDLLGDDAAGTLEGKSRVLGSLGVTGATKVFGFRVKSGGSSTSAVVRVRDTTAAADRLLAVINANTFPPTVTMITGTLDSITLVGDEYRIAINTTNVTTANANQLEVYPATTSALAVGNTGTVNIGDFDVQDFDDDRLMYDSGYVTPWPAGLTLEDLDGLNYAAALAFPSVTAQLWAVDIRDSTNPAGFIDLSRLVIAKTFSPAFNFSWNSGVAIEDLSKVEETEGGAALMFEHPKRRAVSGLYEGLTETEAWGTGSMWDIMQRAGLTKQVFFMWDASDTTLKHKRSFIARFKTFSPLDNTDLARYRNAFTLVEEI